MSCPGEGLSLRPKAAAPPPPCSSSRPTLGAAPGPPAHHPDTGIHPHSHSCVSPFPHSSPAFRPGHGIYWLVLLSVLGNKLGWVRGRPWGRSPASLGPSCPHRQHLGQLNFSSLLPRRSWLRDSPTGEGKCSGSVCCRLAVLSTTACLTPPWGPDTAAQARGAH